MTPQDIKGMVSLELRKRRITHEQASKVLGMATRQSFSNLMSVNKYFSPAQAQSLSDEYGFRYEFLAEGKGPMYKDQKYEHEAPVDHTRVSQTQYELVYNCLKTVVGTWKNPPVNSLFQQLNSIIDTIEGNKNVEQTEFAEMILRYNDQLAYVKNNFQEL